MTRKNASYALGTEARGRLEAFGGMVLTVAFADALLVLAFLGAAGAGACFSLTLLLPPGPCCPIVGTNPICSICSLSPATAAISLRNDLPNSPNASSFVERMYWSNPPAFLMHRIALVVTFILIVSPRILLSIRFTCTFGFHVRLVLRRDLGTLLPDWIWVR